jgi:CRAL/TRIO, N-terminal domain
VLADAWFSHCLHAECCTPQRNVIAMDPKVVEESLEKFIEWIKDQVELPKNIDKILLLRYLKAVNFDLEKAKKLLSNSLHMRHKNPHIFTQRDPHSKEMQNVINTV